MQQEDLIKRQIDQLGQVLGIILADLLRLKNRGQLNGGIEAAHQALKNAVDLDIDDLAAIPTDKFIDTLLAKNKLSNDSFDKLADIFYLLAEELDHPNKDSGKKKKLYEMALIIYEHFDKTSSTYSFDRHFKMVRIKSAI